MHFFQIFYYFCNFMYLSIKINSRLLLKHRKQKSLFYLLDKKPKISDIMIIKVMHKLL